MPGEFVLQPSSQSRPWRLGETGSAGAGSQPRAQDLQEGGLSCARGMEGSWETRFCVWSMLGGALGNVGRAGGCPAEAVRLEGRTVFS